MNAGSLHEIEKRRLGWWLVASALTGVVALFFYSFLGMFILGVFVYYGARPVNRWLLCHVDSRGIAATLTILCIVLPTLALLGYTGFVAVREFMAVAGEDLATVVFDRLPGNQKSVAAVLQDPASFLNQLGSLPRAGEGLDAVLGTLGAVSNALLQLTLALTFAFFLFQDGPRLAAWARDVVGGRDTAAYSYLAAADEDLEVVYFGHVLTVLAVTVAATVIYNGYNLIAPPPVSLPFPTLLAVLTGLATFIPLVVGKVVYVPAAGVLVWQAVRNDTSLLVYPLAFLVAAFLLLDIIPQSVVRPHISGQTLHGGAVLFAYVLGAGLFGWYGLFLGPFLLVLVVQFANVVLDDLVHGSAFSPEPTGATTLGSDPPDGRGGTLTGSPSGEGSPPDEATLSDDAESDGERGTG